MFTHLCTCIYCRAFGGHDGGLTLQQLQVGVAAMEPATPHGGICGQVRAEMIFKYYNKRENGSLNLQEFRCENIVFW